ncbi:MAG: hypothetical protein GF331_01240 [Chitinivibrionales bacterium]|nr:hypothetical protein [Chitinivibrionales bacterium]
MKREPACGIGLLVLLGAVLLARAQTLYWVETSFSAPLLASSSVGGGPVDSVALEPASLPVGLALSATNNDLYIAEVRHAGATVRRYDRMLSDNESVVTGMSSVRGIAVDAVNDRLYLASTDLVGGPAITRTSLDGSASVPLQVFGAGGHVTPHGLALHVASGKLYWADYEAGAIRRADTSAGAPIEEIVSGLAGPVGVAIDTASGRIYWTEAIANQVAWATLEGDSMTTIVSGLSWPSYIAVDSRAGRVYWTEIGTPRIMNCRLDGSDPGVVPVPVRHPGGIAITYHKPATPLGVVAHDGVSSIALTWDRLTDSSVSVVRICRDTDAGFGAGTCIDSVGAFDSSYTDSSAEPGEKYYYRLVAVDTLGTAGDPSVIVEGQLLAVSMLPSGTRADIAFGLSVLRSASGTYVRYGVADRVPVRVLVYDVTGRVRAVVADGTHDRGYYAVSTRRLQLGAGLYIVRMQAGAFRSSTGLRLLR